MLNPLKNILGKKSQDDSSAAPKSKKAKGYFLELDDTGNAKPEGEAKKPEPAKAVAKQEAPKAEPKVEAKKPEPVKETPKAQAKPEKVVPQPPPAAASNGRVEPQSGATFAPNNMLPLTTNNSRRRPGPSMNNFLEMARQVKTPNR
ncbi:MULTISPECIES: hypothetical protein [unclassified Coleofasciculus]|uniref:hypothetical protein n=1 Tax=unclassified Coleofasciculus TaxID=2692782 RepID=UPI0018813C35|nr:MULTISPECIES: hypothetical protein [unclassified Coleofasciculus]MBE9129922.1 hypothetical protein [Coleofasciculus sp. LEGE 07081]MBE9152336.1 hypothetical protein [Coleofasciculus sp. LEGE 07092]